MQHLISPRAVVGDGNGAVLLEVRGNAIRIKRRGLPDFFLPLDAARDVGRFLLDVGRQ